MKKCVSVLPTNSRKAAKLSYAESIENGLKIDFAADAASEAKLYRYTNTDQLSA